MRTARLGEVRGGWGGWGRLLLAVLAAGTATTCTTSKTSTHLPQPAFYDPAHDLGSLFQAVQLSGMFVDSKTFADARPRLAPAEITARYASARRAPRRSGRRAAVQPAAIRGGAFRVAPAGRRRLPVGHVADHG